ncbi:MAG TPA: HAMP domain-containing sensor histidine kinase [Candidatus Binatia bacterium]|nr:HAMP domain-containing sensor histidine kinase [Candidatus Binatia bacterium]
MKLARKLTLALALAICALMAVYATWEISQEVTLFDADMKRTARMGRVLASVVEQTWGTEGEEAARRLIAKANHATPIELRLVTLDELAPRLQSELLEQLRHGEKVCFTRDNPDGTTSRYKLVPLHLADDRRWALELVESLRERQTYIRTSETRIVVVAVTLVAASTAVVMLFGFWFVGRPIRQLRDRARAIGSGHYEGRLTVRQRDEIGELAEEINAMSARIAEAQTKLAAETDARIASIEMVRHTDRLTTVGRLAAGIAHELGTPLNVIAGRAKMIAADAPEGAESRENARIIMEQSERMAAIIRQLLDFSRRQGPKLETTNLADVAARTIDLLRSFAQKRGVVLDLEASAGPVLVHGDPSQLQQVLTNVVMNGIQAMPDGGRVAVTIARRDAHPPGTEAPRAPYACVTVEDQGRGIPAENIPRIFEPFFTTKGVGEGTGLGLSVAYGIVQEHGGWIEVESRVGRGARFAIFLPVGEPGTVRVAS